MGKKRWHVTPVGSKLGITEENLIDSLPNQMSRGAGFMEAAECMTVKELADLITCSRMISESSPKWHIGYCLQKRLIVVELLTSGGVHQVVFLVEGTQVGLVAISLSPVFQAEKGTEELRAKAGDAILTSIREFNVEEDEIVWKQGTPDPSGHVM